MVYGRLLALGYRALRDWCWSRPWLAEVLISANRGLLSWTPILLPALVGLAWGVGRDRETGLYLVAVCVAFIYFIAAYPAWHGISSFGNRFFVSLTPVFVHRPGGAAGSDRSRWPRPGGGDRPSRGVEPGAHLPVGHQHDPQPRPRRLAGSRAQPAAGPRTGADRGRRVRDGPFRPARSNPAGRPPRGGTVATLDTAEGGRRVNRFQALRELWAFRHTVLAFAERDVRLKYRQTTLDVLWAVVRIG